MGPAWDRENSPVKDLRSTTVQRSKSMIATASSPRGIRGQETLGKCEYHRSAGS